MKYNQYLLPAITTVFLLLSPHTSYGDAIDQDLTTICGWYKSLSTEEKFKHFSSEDKFSYVFNAKTYQDINNIQMKMFYSALRNTESKQRYELMKAYAEGTSGKSWDWRVRNPGRNQCSWSDKSPDPRRRHSRQR